MLVSWADWVLNNLISANDGGHFELFMLFRAQNALVAGLGGGRSGLFRGFATFVGARVRTQNCPLF
jgi:hypothetical protein